MLMLARFSLQSYTRSYRYFAPVMASLIAMILLYSYKPNPVMDSYAATSILLFVGMAWMGLSFLNHGHIRQEQLSMIHIGNKRKYALSQMAALLVPILLLTLFFVIYPILTGMFEDPVGVGRLFIAISAHLTLGMLGAALAFFFQVSWMPNSTRAIAILCIVIIISIAFKAMLDKLPDQIMGVQWIVPPAYEMMNVILNADHLSRSTVWFSILHTLIYTIILGCIYLFFAGRKDARN